MQDDDWDGGVELYAGSDLQIAAERTRAPIGDAGSRSTGLARRVWRDVRNTELQALLPRKQWVTGTEKHSGHELRLLFAGSLRMLSHMSDLAFGSENWRTSSASGVDPASADLVVADHPLVARMGTPKLTIRTPPWIRLELELGNAWESTLAALPAQQPKRIRRYLRRFGYRATCSTGPDTIREFRNEFLLPHAYARFGDAAIVASEDSFMAECGDMIRLDLLLNDAVVASNLISIDGRRMTIAKGAPAPGLDDLKGRMDTIDYFSLLLAQAVGANLLDFGLCRTNLDDGPLRYKAKWGARIVPAGGLKTDTRILCFRLSEAVRAFLRHNLMLEREADEFVVRMLADREDVPDRLARLMTLADIRGVRRIDVLYEASSGRPDLPTDSSVPLRAVPLD